MIASFEIPNANKAARGRGHLEHHSNATLSFILQCKMSYFGKHINLSVCYSHIWFRSIEESTFWCLRMLHANTSFVSKTWHRGRRELKGNVGTSNAVVITRDKQQHTLSTGDSTGFRSGRPSLSSVLLSTGYIILGKSPHFSESLFPPLWSGEDSMSSMEVLWGLVNPWTWSPCKLKTFQDDEVW